VGDGEDIAKAVFVEAGHGGEIGGESLAVSCLKLRDQVLDVLGDKLLRGALLASAGGFVLVVVAEFHSLFLSCRFRLFLFFVSAAADKNRRSGGKDRTEDSGGWQGASGGALSAKGDLCLARKRRYSKHPSEPRNGVHPMESEVGKRREAMQMIYTRLPVLSEQSFQRSTSSPRVLYSVGTIDLLQFAHEWRRITLQRTERLRKKTIGKGLKLYVRTIQPRDER